MVISCAVCWQEATCEKHITSYCIQPPVPYCLPGISSLYQQ